MRSRSLLTLAALCAVWALIPAVPAQAEECALIPKAKCFGVGSLSASLSTTQAGDHPDLTFAFDVARDPTSSPNSFGERNSYAKTRNIRIDLPPGLIGDPNVLGLSQQCTAADLNAALTSGGCPNGSQIGVTEIYAYQLNKVYLEPIYMMQPPGGDVVARLGFIAGILPTYVDLRVRSEGDYGLTAEIINAPTVVTLLKAKTTTWGIPADPSHDTERCTPFEAEVENCRVSLPRPPGSRPLPFLTNPTRCGVALEIAVNAYSWLDSGFDPAKEKTAPLATITGCDKLPFGPSLAVEPTTRQAASPTGADATIRLPAADGVNVLEPSQIKDIRIELPEGFAFNPAAGDGLETCSPAQVRFGTREPSACPDGAKLAEAEFDIPVLERSLKGAVYLREPEPGSPFRIWVTADDLGLRIKLPGELEVDKTTGQITSITTDVPQAPLREARLRFKSGLRAPLVTPDRCGIFQTEYQFTSWAGGPPKKGSAPVTIDSGCDTGRFDPSLEAGTLDPGAGRHSPFVFTLSRQDGEQNPVSLDIVLPSGLAAAFRGLARCEGEAAVAGACSAASRVGHVIAAVGAGPNPLWVPQAGKRPTAVYLGGPYKDGPSSIIAVVPRQAGPFDFGDEVVRSAVYVDPVTAQATVRSDPLPQRIEGIPISYRNLHVSVDRPNFTLNPTSCASRSIDATVTSTEGAQAHPSAPFAAINCATLGFKPKLSMRLFGGTSRGSHPRLRTILRMPPGGANISAFSVALPRSEFLDQAHIKTVCTRVQFRANQCPVGSIYGEVAATTPILDEPLTGLLYLRSSDNPLPDMVAVLKGPPSLPVEIHAVGRIDSVNGGIRATFDAVPDAPVTEIVARFPGGNKGLIVNSTNLCKQVNRVTAKFFGQNGRRTTLRPALQNSCKKKANKHKRRR